MYLRYVDNPEIGSTDVLMAGRKAGFVLVLHYSPDINKWFFVAHRQQFEFSSIRQNLVFNSREACEDAAEMWAIAHKRCRE